MSDISLSRVTVIVPTLNAARKWKPFRAGLAKQGLNPLQVLIVDSSSADETVGLARAEGYRVMNIRRSEFNHGGSRQRAAEQASGADIAVYLTQDAILESDRSVLNLIQPFKNPKVGACYGRQLPHTGAGLLEAHARSFNYPATSVVRTLDARATLGFKAAFGSNSFAAYRLAALKAVGGFPRNVIVCEDTIVFARMLMDGWTTQYVADATVRHSHSYSLSQEFSRYFDTGVLHARENWLMEEFGGVRGEGRRFVISELRSLWPQHATLIPSAALRILLRVGGYHIGRLERYLSPSLASKLSQQKSYWRPHPSLTGRSMEI